MKIGTYYYPEQWPQDQWERDFDHIAALGLQIVHMAEFAWFSMEPRPGHFDFAWLDRAMELAAARKLDVILCTPTAAPPIWLSVNIPQTLPVDRHGTRARFGGRRHYNPASPEMHDAARRIVSVMAKRYGNHPSVIGWQIDNEYGHSFDQGPDTHIAFRQWLRRKYETIENLNRAWGNQFWNQYYTSFDEILLPPSREPGYSNQHPCLDASRFWSWAWANFNRIQAEQIKPYIGNRFLTTNFMPMYLDIDPVDMKNELSLFSWDSYPVSGWDKETPGEEYRIANPAGIGFMHDQMASYNSRWALMELQPGQVNWSGVPVRVYPGVIRLWIWTAFAHGAEFVTTYRFRQPRFGIELFHHGLVNPDGKTLSSGGEQFAQVIREMKQLDLLRIPALGQEPIDPQRTVGIVLDWDQLWYFKSLPQAKRWDQPKWLTMWYAALSQLGVRILVLRPGETWPANLPLIVAPALQMLDHELTKKLTDYAAAGGELVLTCRTGLMNRDGQLWEGPTASPILEMIGSTIQAYDGLREGHFGQIDFNGQQYPWGVWGDQVLPGPTASVLATYADQFYAGAAAITQHAFGSGRVTYFGVYSEPALVNAFVKSLAETIPAGKLATNPVDPRVQLLQRGPYHIVLNYQETPIEAPAPANARFVLGSRTVGPADIAIWEV